MHFCQYQYAFIALFPLLKIQISSFHSSSKSPNGFPFLSVIGNAYNVASKALVISPVSLSPHTYFSVYHQRVFQFLNILCFLSFLAIQIWLKHSYLPLGQTHSYIFFKGELYSPWQYFVEPFLKSYPPLFWPLAHTNKTAMKKWLGTFIQSSAVTAAVPL